MVKYLVKKSNPVISIIVPIHVLHEKIPMVRNSIFLAKTPIEVIYVVEKNLINVFTDIKKCEKIIKMENIGRGFMQAEGVHNSSGDIILFLHSDTILPDEWDKSILSSLKDEKVIGGEFKLRFDIKSTYLDFTLNLISSSQKITKMMFGDRAIFVRSNLIKKNISILQIPIMEDLELSNLMRKNGNVIIIDKNVITSADAFVNNGFLHQTIKIIISILWYRIGGNLQDIFNYYYSNDK